MRAIQLKVNGKVRTVEAESEWPLLDVLRNDLGLTGAKYGCGEGQCGACTVLIDGRASRSCVTPVSRVEGKEITTIEALAEAGELHPLQKAFLDEGALQCGYCTPGMIMSALGLLGRNSQPSESQILAALQGNVCRCGTYIRIVRAVQRAGREMESTREA